MIARSEKQKGKLVSATFSVTIRPSELSNQDTVERLTRTIALLHPTAEVGAVKLPCGVAAPVTEDRQVPEGVTLLGKPRKASTVRQCHALIPIPDRTAVADFSICTEDIEGWDDHVAILAGICATITFT
ncbi:hypothetical protein [Allokutzneria albata]|uniref:Uncharacterized protein n=1 Tax=Allokutzneria albata TaxID=211114 RepID=A0A1G9S9J0_ALLAB|nr:hypothetical protein [Allokutzneria albata]SDM32139.1 hypothetical protein SAMN04489726_0993 [Allokutzneria albata]